jgi:hypothetical protein
MLLHYSPDAGKKSGCNPTIKLVDAGFLDDWIDELETSALSARLLLIQKSIYPKI